MPTVLRELRRCLRGDGSLVVGFFASERLEPFPHTVTTAYSWPVDELTRLVETLGSWSATPMSARTPAGPIGSTACWWRDEPDRRPGSQTRPILEGSLACARWTAGTSKHARWPRWCGCSRRTSYATGRRRAGALELELLDAAAHVAHDLLAYAGQVAAQPGSAYLPFDLTIRADAPPRDVLEVVVACGRLLSSALDATGPDARAWHWGATDRAASQRSGSTRPCCRRTTSRRPRHRLGAPEPLCAAVLARLFTDAPEGDPVQVLLWSTGRGELEGRPRVTSWISKAAVDLTG